MARRKPFRLAAVLKLRAKAEQDARSDLGEATAAQRDAEALLHQRYAELTSSVMPKQTSAAAMQAIMYARTSTRAAFDEARAALIASEQRTDEATAAWREAYREHDAVVRLQDRHREQQRREQIKGEQLTQDDITGSRYAKRAREEDDTP